MDSYFFIPATKLDKFVQIAKKKPTEIIIDFEDAIKASDLDALATKFQKVKPKGVFVRIPVMGYNTGKLNLKVFERFLNMGHKKFVLPKLTSLCQLERIREKSSESLELILLVENTSLYFDLFRRIHEFGDVLKAIALGSHDFMSSLNATHSSSTLFMPRQHILFLANSIGIEAIDIASMDTQLDQGFYEELKEGKELGYCAKFLIHPKQLEALNQYSFYSKEDYEKARSIMKMVDKVEGNEDEFNAILINGEIIEKPHIKRAKMILESLKKKNESIQ